MNFEIITVGTLKEKYLKEACNEYIKRIDKYARLTITEIKESKLSKNPSQTDIHKALEEEGLKIIEKTTNTYSICLAIEGNQLSTEKLAEKIQNLQTYQQKRIAFIVGSSHGLSETVKSKADFLLSLSDMTFPHQLTRVILLEQLYRLMSINNNEPYHK